MCAATGSGPDPVHVWVAPAGDEPRSAAHRLLRDLVADLLGGTPVLRHAASGRPEVDGLAVSLSHIPGLVVVAAGTEGPIGVDAEWRRDTDGRVPAALAGRWFTPTEAARIEVSGAAEFLRLWTAKEAVGKALGHGLRGGGLRRPMPVPPSVAEEPGVLAADAVPDHDPLVVVRVPVRYPAVVTLACSRTVRTVVLGDHEDAARRSPATSRTSFPVVVRGN